MAEPIDTSTCCTILREIASGCSQVSLLAGMAIEKANDPSAIDTLGNAIQVMANRMGWLAELVAEDLGERAQVVGTDALDWMMPIVAGALREGRSHG